MGRFKRTTATDKIFAMTKRYRAVAGGTSASKTISIVIWLIDYAQTHENKDVWVVSESFPHLKGGALKDFEDIMKDAGYWDDKRFHGSDYIYTFETGTKIKFTSVDSYGKAHGPRRDVLYLNECNNLSFNIIDQLIVRTRQVVWMDWNPTTEFWFYPEFLNHPTRSKQLDFVTVTYKDNEALDELTVVEIESHKENKNWWRVYGLGQLGEVEGRIYTGWRVIDEVPFEARLEGYGMDFGYSNDPTAIVAVYYHNGGYIFDEVLYRKGLFNSQIADHLKALPYGLVVADSAEPKSIDEIASYGISIIGAKKGKDSIRTGIDWVQSNKISVTKRSVNLLKEYRAYLWMTDKDGNTINEPQGGFDHALDAARYRMEALKPATASFDTNYSTGNIASLWG